MARARRTLTLARLTGRHPFHEALSDSPAVLRRSSPVAVPPPAPELERSYRRLTLGDVFIGFAGYRAPGDRVHRAIAGLSPGDLLQIRMGARRYELLDSTGTVVGQLVGGFEVPSDMRCAFATVMAISTWDRERSEPEFQDRLQCDAWEVIVPELVFEPDL